MVCQFFGTVMIIMTFFFTFLLSNLVRLLYFNSWVTDADDDIRLLVFFFWLM